MKSQTVRLRKPVPLYSFSPVWWFKRLVTHYLQVCYDEARSIHTALNELVCPTMMREALFSFPFLPLLFVYPPLSFLPSSTFFFLPFWVTSLTATNQALVWTGCLQYGNNRGQGLSYLMQYFKEALNSEYHRNKVCRWEDQHANSLHGYTCRLRVEMQYCLSHSFTEMNAWLLIGWD